MRKLVALALVSLSTFLSLDGCRETPNAGPTTTAPSIIAPDSEAIPSALPSAVVNAAPSAACVVAYVTWPGGDGPSPGDDLEKAPVPFRVPEGASVSISVRRTGHEVRIKGPAVFRGCTHEEPDVVLLASGDASLEGTAPVHPGAELFLATPAFVAVVSRATVRVHATASLSSWEVESGEVMITNLDTPNSITTKSKGSLKRYEDGGVLLTRCGVQAASASSAERMLMRFSQPDAGPPLPAASIGILTAQQIKHARERVLDCAFAEAFALGCDTMADAPPAGCNVTYARVREHIGRSSSPQPLPSGSPPPSPPDAGGD